jgi:predicted acylesterase/phospholipase RssA
MVQSIAFGGGGMRGGLHMGALRALADVHPTLSFPDGIYGCSIGCIFALATAFRVDLDALEAAYSTYFGVEALLPYATLENLQSILDTNGLMPMDGYLKNVVEGFLSMGIDLRSKVMSDAPQPLSFLASNMTTGRSVWLTGQVPILDALACSGCIPFVFRPQVVYGHVYLDGGVFTRCIASVVDTSTLVVHVSGIGCSVTPNSGLGDIVAAIYGGPHAQYRGRNVLRIQGPSMSILSDLTAKEKKHLVNEGYSQARAFFAKRFPKELEES